MSFQQQAATPVEIWSPPVEMDTTPVRSYQLQQGQEDEIQQQWDGVQRHSDA